MSELHFPWIEVAILIPLIGAIWVGRLRDPDRARQTSVVISGFAFLCTIGEWLDFDMVGSQQAEDHWHLMTRLVGGELFRIDQLRAADPAGGLAVFSDDGRHAADEDSAVLVRLDAGLRGSGRGSV